FLDGVRGMLPTDQRGPSPAETRPPPSHLGGFPHVYRGYLRMPIVSTEIDAAGGVRVTIEETDLGGYSTDVIDDIAERCKNHALDVWQQTRDVILQGGQR